MYITVVQVRTQSHAVPTPSQRGQTSHTNSHSHSPKHTAILLLPHTPLFIRAVGSVQPAIIGPVLDPTTAMARAIAPYLPLAILLSIWVVVAVAVVDPTCLSPSAGRGRGHCSDVSAGFTTHIAPATRSISPGTTSHPQHPQHQLSARAGRGLGVRGSGLGVGGELDGDDAYRSRAVAGTTNLTVAPVDTGPTRRNAGEELTLSYWGVE